MNYTGEGDWEGRVQNKQKMYSQEQHTNVRGTAKNEGLIHHSFGFTGTSRIEDQSVFIGHNGMKVTGDWSRFHFCRVRVASSDWNGLMIKQGENKKGINETLKKYGYEAKISGG